MMRIDYKFDESHNTIDIFSQGGLLFEYDGTVITKRTTNYKDDGFRGDYLLSNIICILDCLPVIINGQTRICNLLDHLSAFFFFPEGENIRIVYRNLGNDTLTQRENEKYPNKGKGCLVPLYDFVPRFIKLSKKFLSDIILQNPKLSNEYELIVLKKSIQLAEDAWGNFNNKNF